MSMRIDADRDAVPVGTATRGPVGTGSPRDPGRHAAQPADPAVGPPESVVTVAEVRSFIRRAEQRLIHHRSYLDRLDAKLGDGDHGENMTVGFAQAVRALIVDPADGSTPPETAEDDVGDLLRRLGYVIAASVGGAGGSLYGTAFIEAGRAVAGSDHVAPAALADAFRAAAEAVARRGRCRIGDKTIYDALRPAADAFADAVLAGEPLGEALRRAAHAACAGMRATVPLVARRGLALRLGERSRGRQDPGATSCFLLVRAMLGPAGGEPAETA